MTLGNQVPDKALLKQVVQRLRRHGSSASSKVTATVRSGDVTLTGSVGYEHERRSVLKCAGGVMGVHRVIDQLRVEPKKKSWA